MAFSLIEAIVVALLLALPFAYESSPKFRYYLKFFLYYGLVMTTAVFVIPIMMFRPGEVKNLLLASFLCRHISKLVGLRWELRGREHLEKDMACVIVANHQSSLDILGMFELWPVMEKCTVVAKKELLYAWPFGLAAWLCGLVFIDRLNADKARESMNQATKHIQENKIKLWIFPEGTRNNASTMLPFKKGAFHVAVSGQIPILPVVFSSYYYLDHTKKTFDEGRVIMTCLPAINTTGLGKDDIANLVEQTRNDMIAEFHRSSAEVLMELNRSKPADGNVKSKEIINGDGNKMEES
ncbi:1-acyl-sn-glycerol-3-phosphate acyltransferase alpha [Neocloeon triangulifer]|uniref:1-acyl-sn-glycerol-3-phosphate acyltransferase alpha n=1 Tax=Neocloeon triangulifer TaxID=2078957 RepID=UPI00286F5BA4|nr:1-acyl-sn-glycerol-3-phosphate acyltransferase alpha [Neocloeon triangulifer]